jgi:hypothetical protein
VSGIALAQRLPSWKAYAEHLSEIIATADQILSAVRRFEALTMWKRNELPAKPGVLSLDETVKIYLEFLDAAPKTHLDAGEIEAVRKACAEVLERVKPLASKRGRKENVNFYLFMEALFKLAQESGAEVTLPSRQTKGKFGAQDRTAFPRSSTHRPLHSNGRLHGLALRRDLHGFHSRRSKSKLR